MGKARADQGSQHLTWYAQESLLSKLPIPAETRRAQPHCRERILLSSIGKEQHLAQ